MLCGALRARPWGGVAPSLVACLALVAGIAVIPATWPEEEAPSLTLTTRNFPLTALAEGGGIRVEKQAQPHRPVVKKPEGTERLSTVERGANLRPSNATSHILRSLPRRNTYATRDHPSSSDDPSDRFPS
jgi:hypothetical protein